MEDELDKELGSSGMHIDGEDDVDEDGLPKKHPIDGDEEETDEDDEAPM